MRRNYCLFFFLFITGQLFCNITVTSPRPNQVVTSSVVEFKASAEINLGFYFVNDEMIPIRQEVNGVDIPLHLGKNNVCIHVFDEHREIQRNLSRCMTVFRLLRIKDQISAEDAMILTELTMRYHLNFLSNGQVFLNEPIYKRDLYAILMWFFKNEARQSTLKYAYDDMMAYPQYLAAYRQRPEYMPMPYLGRFYPDSYVTRDDFVNLLLILVGSSEQISTSLILNEDLIKPDSITSYIPNDWVKPLVFVTKQEVLHSFKQLYGKNNNIMGKLGAPTVISWPKAPLEAPVELSLFKPITRFFSGLKLRLSRNTSDVVSFSEKDPQSTFFSTMITKASMALKPMSEPRKKKSKKTIVVQPGDSIHKISRRIYKRSSKWKDLVDANQLEIKYVTVNGKLVTKVAIFPGQELLLP